MTPVLIGPLVIKWVFSGLFSNVGHCKCFRAKRNALWWTKMDCTLTYRGYVLVGGWRVLVLRPDPCETWDNEEPIMCMPVGESLQKKILKNDIIVACKQWKWLCNPNVEMLCFRDRHNSRCIRTEPCKIFAFRSGFISRLSNTSISRLPPKAMPIWLTHKSAKIFEDAFHNNN